jgi:Major Facilitator Superfamily
MAPVGVAFAVLDTGGNASDLGLVLTASVIATIAFLLVGGVVADRFSRRGVMLGSDTLRCAAQGAFAVLVLMGHPPLWALIGLSAVGGAGTGLFSPALTALTTEVVRADDLHDANVLLGMAKNIGIIAGPAIAGALIAVTSAGVVVAIDAATYAVSVISLALLHFEISPRGVARSKLDDLRDGWGAWTARPWIWITDIKFALFNAVVYAPLLVLGPAVARARLGGATPWGLILTAQGAGAVVAGLALIGRRPSRPLVVITIAQAAWALPLAGLALLLPVPVIAVGAFAAGIGSATFFAIWTTTLQRNVPPRLLARVSSYDYLSSFAFAPIGLAVVGPIASALGSSTLLWIGASWQILSTIVVLALPQIRDFRDPAKSSTVLGVGAGIPL